MRGVPWWGVISSAAAPVLLIGGWTVAAGLQPRFDPVADTVSALAAIGATDRWVMTLMFLLVGACYIVTALALRPARTAGRLILTAGAAAGMLVAANPEHPGGFGSVPHFVWASLGFAGLTLWPAGAAKRGPAVPWGLRPAVAAAAVAVHVRPARLVRRRADPGRRAGRAGRAGGGRRPGGLAPGGGAVLLPPGQSARAGPEG